VISPLVQVLDTLEDRPLSWRAFNWGTTRYDVVAEGGVDRRAGVPKGVVGVELVPVHDAHHLGAAPV